MVKDGINMVINEIIKQIGRINNNSELIYIKILFFMCVCVCVCVLVCVNRKVNLFCDECQKYTKDKW